jgi:anti-anti-sigma regulatory factor
VVFSLFARKEKPDPRKKAPEEARSRAAPDTKTRTSSSSSQPRAGISANPTAMQTMAKIDAIESEMNMAAQDPVVSPRPATKAPASTTLSSPPNPKAAPATSGTQDFATSALLGNSAGASNLEILGSGVSPVLEEAAILFSNGQAAEAASLLQSDIAENAGQPTAQASWLMLFDVYQALNKETEFENLSIDYAARFELSPPAWRGKRATDEDKQTNGNYSLVLTPDKLDQNITKIINQIQTATGKGRPVLLEMSKLKQIEPFAAEQLLKTLNAFKKAKREIAFAPVENLATACRAGVEAGRRDTSDAIWLLLMESLRLLGKQQEFEDTSIDYCVTFEVSPPSWEPMPDWIRAEAAAPTTVAEGEKLGTRVEEGVFHLVGDLKGSIAVELGLLTEYASSRRDVLVECSDLRRVEFVTAGQLQNQLTTMRNLGKNLILHNVTMPVATLFGVVGMNDIATIRLRAH